MKLRIAALAAAGVLGASAFAAGSIAGPALNNKYESSEHEATVCLDSNDQPVGTVAYTGPDFMWPPNHKMQPFKVTADDVDATAADNDLIDLVLTVTSDETVDGEEMNGSGNTGTDYEVANVDAAEDTAIATGELRSERSGRGDGRTYTIDWVATFQDGTQDAEGYGTVECDGTILVEVPHDQRGGAGWKHDTDGDGDGDNGGNQNDRNDTEE